MKKLLISLSMFLCLPLAVGAADIVIDNDFSDWPEGTQVIDETGVADITDEFYCYNSTTQGWDEVASIAACTNSYVYNEMGQIDLQTGYFHLTTTDMYVGFTTAFANMAAYDTTNSVYVPVQSLPYEHNVTTIPSAFDHDMIFSFGPADEETFDYYLVAEMFIPADLTQLGDDIALKVYQETNGTVGYQAGEETLLGTMDTSNSESGSGPGTSTITEAFEVRQNFEAFLALTGMTFDTEYGFRLETASVTGDTTARVLVDFSSAALSKPNKGKVKKLKKRSCTLNWADVTGATYYKLQLRKNNKKAKLVKKFKNVAASKKTLKKSKKYLKVGKKYKYRTKACNSGGCSAWSKYKAFETKS